METTRINDYKNDASPVRIVQDDPFTLDVKGIQERARRKMMEGPVTDSLGLPVDQIIGVLNEVLASEIVCNLRYLSHMHRAEGIRAEVAAGEFREHAEQERQHMAMVAERIGQLGGEPDFTPNTLQQRSHADFEAVEATGDELADMVRSDLVAERVAVETYREIVRWLGDRDPVTRRMMEDILAQEEHQADDMRSLMVSFEA